MADSLSRRSRRAVSVPAADGYHFGDEHPWGETEQDSLIRTLQDVRAHFNGERATEAGSEADNS